MKKFREEASRDQILLLPPSIEEFVTENDGVRYVDTFVEELDLTSIEDTYKGGGRPAYRPKTLVKILVYGTIRGIRSSRELCQACRENLRFIYLAKNEKPDFRTISDFRKLHLENLGGILKQTVEIGIKEGFINLKQVSIDGTKIRTEASRRSFKDVERLKKLLKALEKTLEEGIEVDSEEDKRHGNEDGDFNIPAGLEERKALRDKIRTAIEHHDNLEKGVKGTKPKDVSLTDPEARFMKGQNGHLPSYNAQLCVDTESHLSVGARVTNNCVDVDELIADVEEVKKNTGEKPEVVLVDKGYFSKKNVEELSDKEVEIFVPLKEAESGIFSLMDFEYDEENDEYICPDGNILEFKYENVSLNEDVYKSLGCEGCRLSAQCLKNPKKNNDRILRVSAESEAMADLRQRMTSSRAKKAMNLRAQTVELSFAWMKSHRKLRRFFFKGLNQVHNYWKFEVAVGNIVRINSLREQNKAVTI